MSETFVSMFAGNPGLVEQIEAFCARDPAYIQARQAFYETAHQVAERTGFDLYDDFERRFITYMGRAADLYYLFGLGLRQEVLYALAGDLS